MRLVRETVVVSTRYVMPPWLMVILQAPSTRKYTTASLTRHALGVVLLIVAAGEPRVVSTVMEDRAAIVAAELRRLGFDVATGIAKTGVVASLSSGSSARTRWPTAR